MICLITPTPLISLETKTLLNNKQHLRVLGFELKQKMLNSNDFKADLIKYC
jgi:hypothetical protein